MSPIGAVMVIGGGVTGIQASLDLADLGFYTYLIEKGPSIGGIMSELDKTFPTLDCSMCILSPRLVTSSRHPNIRIITNAEVKAVKGTTGRFQVTVLKKPRYVNEEKCVGCGKCSEYCPIPIPDEHNERLSACKAIHVPFPQAVPAVATLDERYCRFHTRTECAACRPVCSAEAIQLDDQVRNLELEVGGIIVSPGFEKFDPGAKQEYGYSRYQNVIDSLEFERILCASGPTQGRLIRPSDKTHPKRIAWLQCVGSRDVASGNSHCSSVCCMVAIKQAIAVREKSPDTEVSIFYNDMRTVAKGAERFRDRAHGELDVRFVKGLVSSIKELQESKGLFIRHVSERGDVVEEEFDLAVLSVGMTASKDSVSLCDRLSILTSTDGFLAHTAAHPLRTLQPGIFAAGAALGPKDIPESVVEASAAAGLCSQLLSSARGERIQEKALPEEIDVSGERARIGVFLCRCGINIAGVIDTPRLGEYTETLDHVEYVEEGMYTCSRDHQERIGRIVGEQRLNRILVAACTPRTHEPLFQQTMKEAGLNPSLFEMVNIREHCSWVHPENPQVALEKAKDLVRMGVAKAALLKPLEQPISQVVPKCAIIGGGLSGMVASLSLAEQGFGCFLLEKEAHLGGNLRRLHYTLDGEDPQELLRRTIQEVMGHPRITVFTEAHIEAVNGYVGDFSTTFLSHGERHTISHGVFIVATGAKEYRPEQYLYGDHEKVMTQKELETGLSTESFTAGDFRHVVMIQCVGSRNRERVYCSRICCAQAIKNALQIKRRDPSCQIHILHRDIRTYGLSESAYLEAREKGVVFAPYDADNPPDLQVHPGRLALTVWDPVWQDTITLNPSLVVLSTAIVPSGNDTLSKTLRVPLDADGFFAEAHVKLRPVDFTNNGIYLCGLAHFPKTVNESICQAEAAAARAAAVLWKDHVLGESIVSAVIQEKCFGCGECETACPFAAIRVSDTGNGRKAGTIPASCKGCGVCAVRCPREAISMGGFDTEQIVAQIRAVNDNPIQAEARNGRPN